MKKLLFIATLAALPLLAADPAPEPLWGYQGTWEFTKDSPLGSAIVNKPQKIQNDCADIGQFFVCQQTVDGKLVALLTFTRTSTKGHYYAVPVLPNGHAAGYGELDIEGDRWTYPKKEEVNGKTVYTRVVNIFSGKDHVRFEQSESSDGVNWKVLASGKEVRLSQSGTLPAPRHN